jgi:hypothetical protein
MQAIVICHVSNPGISVLLESIKVYAPTIPVYIYSVDVARGERFKRILPNVIVRPNTGRNFGDSYNEAISDVFGRIAVDSLIVANDDVVLNPQTIELLGEDRLTMYCQTRTLDSQYMTIGSKDCIGLVRGRLRKRLS